MNELKPEDVMRALECHATDYKPPMEGVFHCKTDCPYHQFDFCTRVLTQDALALLREKDAEIERLMAEIGRFAEALFEKMQIARAEAITEFADELERHFCHDPAFLGVEQRLIMDVIRQKAKELKEAPKWKQF